MGMGIGCWDQVDDISSAWLIGLWLRRYDPKKNEDVDEGIITQ